MKLFWKNDLLCRRIQYTLVKRTGGIEKEILSKNRRLGRLTILGNTR